MNTENKAPVVLWNNKLLPVCITGCRGGGTYLCMLGTTNCYLCVLLVVEEEVHISVY